MRKFLTREYWTFWRVFWWWMAVVFAASGLLPMSGTAVALLAMAVCNVPMALLALFLSRGIFAQAELNR